MFKSISKLVLITAGIFFILYLIIMPLTVVCNTEKMYVLNFEVSRIKNIYFIGDKAYPVDQCTVTRHWLLKYSESI
jgi:hypothetical protein